jgi:endoribonuclease Dicer
MCYLKMATFTPLIFRQLVHRCLVSEFLELAGFKADLDDLVQAFTSPAANQFCNYERLEFYGDAFLKYHLSLHIFLHYPMASEGEMTERRMKLENNRFLRSRLVTLEGLVLAKPFSRSDYVPLCNQAQTSTQSIADATLSDVVEAIIGSALLTDVSSAYHCISYFLGPDFYEQSQYRKLCDSVVHSYPRSSKTEITILGYTFRNPSLFLSAMTHPSVAPFSDNKNYQSLEFLGDALLSFLSAKAIYSQSPSFSESQMTDIRSQIVSNQYLACVCIVFSLQEHLLLNNTALNEKINDWKKELTTLSSQDSSDRLYWSRINSAPKVLGDIVESLLGAIHLDSGLDLEASNTVFKRLIFHDSLYPRIENHFKRKGKFLNPTQEVHELRSSLKCLDMLYSVKEHADGFECNVQWHKQLLATAVRSNSDDARKEASFLVLERKDIIDAAGKLCNHCKPSIVIE